MIEVSIPRYTGRVHFHASGEVTHVQTRCYGPDGAYWRAVWYPGKGKMGNLAACLVRAATAKRAELSCEARGMARLSHKLGSSSHARMAHAPTPFLSSIRRAIAWRSGRAFQVTLISGPVRGPASERHHRRLEAMPRQVVTTVYTYDELSDSAKDKARDWYRAGMEPDEWSEHVISDFVTIAGFCGWTMKQHEVKLMNNTTRMEPNIYWSGFSSQGDGACFEGDWRPRDVDARALRAHAPRDKELHKIGSAFSNLKRALRSEAGAAAVHSGRGVAEYNVSFQAWGFGSEATREKREEALEEASRKLMKWLYRSLEREYEYVSADDQVAEALREGEFEFTEAGKFCR